MILILLLPMFKFIDLGFYLFIMKIFVSEASSSTAEAFSILLKLLRLEACNPKYDLDNQVFFKSENDNIN